MKRDLVEIGACPECAQGTVTCTHNKFIKDERVDSWEHRCNSCSFRETQAEPAVHDPAELSPKPPTCPMCGRQLI